MRWPPRGCLAESRAGVVTLRLLHTALAIEPAASVRWIHDPFGNSIAIATFEGETQVLELTSTIRLEHFALPL